MQAAIDAAAQSSTKVVFVSRAFFGYDASRVRFESSVHMTREGHVTAMKGVLAYGALGDRERDDTAGILMSSALAMLAPPKRGRVHVFPTEKRLGRPVLDALEVVQQRTSE